MKLGEKGDREAGPQGEGALPGARRREPAAERIARRLAASVAAPEVEGVQPLNPGFFAVERMRSRVAGDRQERVVGK